MATLITDIAASVMAGDDDTALNVVIQQYITDWELTETVAEWRVTNYQQLREWAYPTFTSLIVALSWGDQDIIDAYADIYFAVDTRFMGSAYPENTVTTAESEPYVVIADSVDTFTFTGCTPGTIVDVEGPGMFPESLVGVHWPPGDMPLLPQLGVFWFVTGSGGTQFTFSVDTPGEYILTFYTAGYLYKQYTITAEAP